MSKYRKITKPELVVEAFQWTGGHDQTYDPPWIIAALADGRATIEWTSARRPALCIAGESTLVVFAGDFVALGPAGLHACTAKEFELEFEPVPEEKAVPSPTLYEELPRRVEAYRWPGLFDPSHVPSWLSDSSVMGKFIFEARKEIGELAKVRVNSYRGWQEGLPGDYIVKDRHGALTVCPAAEFETRYTALDENGEVPSPTGDDELLLKVIDEQWAKDIMESKELAMQAIAEECDQHLYEAVMDAARRPGSEPPPRKCGWGHSKQVLVWYPQTEDRSACYGIAFYHYATPYDEVPKWTDFSGKAYGRQPEFWWPLSDIQPDGLEQK